MARRVVGAASFGTAAYCRARSAQDRCRARLRQVACGAGQGRQPLLPVAADHCRARIAARPIAVHPNPPFDYTEEGPDTRPAPRWSGGLVGRTREWRGIADRADL